MGIERVENEDQSSTLLAGLAVKPVWTEYPDQPSPGGVGNSPCAGDIAGASKPAVGLRWCPRGQNHLANQQSITTTATSTPTGARLSSQFFLVEGFVFHVKFGGGVFEFIPEF